jgi:hypothetical protein
MVLLHDPADTQRLTFMQCPNFYDADHADTISGSEEPSRRLGEF